MKKIVLYGFAILCLACILGITFVLYDVVSSTSNSGIAGYGAAAVFIMTIAFAARRLWERR